MNVAPCTGSPESSFLKMLTFNVELSAPAVASSTSPVSSVLDSLLPGISMGEISTWFQPSPSKSVPESSTMRASYLISYAVAS